MALQIRCHSAQIIAVILGIGQILKTDAAPKTSLEYAKDVICKDGIQAIEPSADYKIKLGAVDKARLYQSKMRSVRHTFSINGNMEEITHYEYAKCTGPAEQQYVWLVTYKAGGKFGYSGPHYEKEWSKKVELTTTGTSKLPYKLVIRSRMAPYIFDQLRADPEDKVSQSLNE